MALRRRRASPAPGYVTLWRCATCKADVPADSEAFAERHVPKKGRAARHAPCADGNGAGQLSFTGHFVIDWETRLRLGELDAEDIPF